MCSPALYSAPLLCRVDEGKWEYPRGCCSGLFWAKLCCASLVGHACEPMPVSEGSVDRFSSGRCEMSQLAHAWSFPSADLHLHEDTVLNVKDTPWLFHISYYICQLYSQSVGRPHHVRSASLEYLLLIKEHALFWELTADVTGTALT